MQQNIQTKHIVRTTAFVLVHPAVFAVMDVNLPILLGNAGRNIVEIGKLLSVYNIVGIFAMLLMGRFLDSHPRYRLSMVVSIVFLFLGFWGLGQPNLSMAVSFWIMGGFASAYQANASAFEALIIYRSDERRYGRIRACYSVSYSFFLLILGLLLSPPSTENLLFYAGLMCFISLTVAGISLGEGESVGESAVQGQQGAQPERYRWRKSARRGGNRKLLWRSKPLEPESGDSEAKHQAQADIGKLDNSGESANAHDLGQLSDDWLAHQPTGLQVLGWPMLLLLLGIASSWALVDGLRLSFLPLYIRDVVGSSRVSLLYSLGGAVEIPIILYSGWLLRRFSSGLMLVCALLASSLRFVLFALFPNFGFMLLVQGLLHPVAYGCFFIGSVAFINKYFYEYRALALSIWSCLRPAIIGLTGGLSGQIIEHNGYKILFLLYATVSLVVLWPLLRMRWRFFQL